ncbi:MAG: TniQ family protein [Xenococcaceae cyanobacterium MO_167.B27]|nr:TniQ family protein [Xenococcaceae cyanobacterium MO_167.B27]
MPDFKELEIYDRLILNNSTTIPQRSGLFFLKPIGVGTPYTESISSYLIRLAQEHCVTPKKLIMAEIAPLIMGGLRKQALRDRI